MIRHGSAASGTVLICGSFLFDKAADHPLLELLPDYMQLRSTGERAHPSGSIYWRAC